MARVNNANGLTQNNGFANAAASSSASNNAGPLQTKVSSKSYEIGQQSLIEENDPILKKMMRKSNSGSKLIHATYWENISGIAENGLIPHKNPKIPRVRSREHLDSVYF